jgi:hypothetical protein
MTAPTSLLEVVRRANADLSSAGGSLALVGGLAVGVHVQARTTRDADFAVAVENDAAAERMTADSSRPWTGERSSTCCSRLRGSKRRSLAMQCPSRSEPALSFPSRGADIWSR